MKWKASSPLSGRSSSGMSGCGGWKLLCTARMVSLLPMARPFMSASIPAVNSRSWRSSGPSSSSGRFMSTDTMACVAQALEMTWLAKKTPLAS